MNLTNVKRSGLSIPRLFAWVVLIGGATSLVGMGFRVDALPLSAGSTLVLQVGGVAGVPEDAVAVALNVTVVEAQAPGFATVYPCDHGRPEASNLNYAAGQTIPNLVLARPDGLGRVCIYSYSTVDLLADVAGFFPSGSGFVSVPNPIRVLDTRNGTGAPAADVSAGSTLVLQVGGVAGVPEDAVAVALNVTVVEAQAPGFATVYPCDHGRPEASNLNYAAGQTIPNLVLARPDGLGRVCIYSYSTVDLLADVAGFFPSGSGFVSVPNPIRVLDTRNSTSLTACDRGAILVDDGGLQSIMSVDLYTGEAHRLLPNTGYTATGMSDGEYAIRVQDFAIGFDCNLYVIGTKTVYRPPLGVGVDHGIYRISLFDPGLASVGELPLFSSGSGLQINGFTADGGMMFTDTNYVDLHTGEWTWAPGYEPPITVDIPYATVYHAPNGRTAVQTERTGALRHFFLLDKPSGDRLVLPTEEFTLFSIRPLVSGDVEVTGLDINGAPVQYLIDTDTGDTTPAAVRQLGCYLRSDGSQFVLELDPTGPNYRFVDVDDEDVIEIETTLRPAAFSSIEFGPWDAGGFYEDFCDAF
jgi:hypothetical protein